MRIVIPILVLLLPFLQGCQRKVAGTFEGTCLNVTYGAQARMILMINQQGERIGGTLTLTGDLNGGGAIAGRIDGKTITFSTGDPITGQITWTGRIKGSEIEGEYYVEPPALINALTGAQSQQGIWKVSRR
jgi:hypothetical protein